MQRREMHPLCCISVDCPGIGDRSPDLEEREPAPEERGGPEGNACGEGESDVSVAGVLYKWTNFGKGWRSRWFTLRNGVLAYSKIRRREGRFYVGSHVRLIGAASVRFFRAMEDGADGRRPKNPVGVVYLKVPIIRGRVIHSKSKAHRPSPSPAATTTSSQASPLSVFLYSRRGRVLSTPWELMQSPSHPEVMVGIFYVFHYFMFLWPSSHMFSSFFFHFIYVLWPSSLCNLSIYFFGSSV